MGITRDRCRREIASAVEELDYTGGTDGDAGYISHGELTEIKSESTHSTPFMSGQMTLSFQLKTRDTHTEYWMTER